MLHLWLRSNELWPTLISHLRKYIAPISTVIINYIVSIWKKKKRESHFIALFYDWHCRMDASFCELFSFGFVFLFHFNWVQSGNLPCDFRFSSIWTCQWSLIWISSNFHSNINMCITLFDVKIELIRRDYKFILWAWLLFSQLYTHTHILCLGEFLLFHFRATTVFFFNCHPWIMHTDFGVRIVFHPIPPVFIRKLIWCWWMSIKANTAGAVNCFESDHQFFFGNFFYHSFSPAWIREFGCVHSTLKFHAILFTPFNIVIVEMQCWEIWNACK